MVPVTLNGQPASGPSGGSVLDLLRVAGLHLPTLCHDDRLAPAGTCRSCLVAVEGHPRLVTACATPLVAGMVITTDTQELQEARRSVLSLLAWRYPAEAARGSPEREFHVEATRLGLDRQFVEAPSPDNCKDLSHPYI